ncbi:MAG: methylated-DNA--[protein]-cysteine S-methyltransferase [Burkholderiales bacterium]|jgi:methylated-DNA-[protein]-cysteine S-methyltransferase|nr:methylated-DNA--[protein]-cysteine S-methyltransferase [Burkholderiales bacterium]
MKSCRSVDDSYGEVWSAKWRAPCAVLGIQSDGNHITRIAFLPDEVKTSSPSDAISDRAIDELSLYFRDATFSFTVPILPQGTLFQQRVWQALREIPTGATLTYQTLADQLKSSPRAVGNACGANPIVIVIPCHRVVARHGLGGFMHTREGDPLHIKRFLLGHESALPEGVR